VRLYPIPVPAGAPAWLNLLLLAGAIVVFVVLVWQAVRYFRNNNKDDES
jgi:hypothetical protein